MKAITQRESVVTYIKSCLIFQIPRFMLTSKYCVISPLNPSLASSQVASQRSLNPRGPSRDQAY